MKNSSRFADAIVRNLSRSRIGFAASRASSSTRPSNSSQDSSRFRNSSGVRLRALAGAVTRTDSWFGRRLAEPQLAAEDLREQVRAGERGEPLHRHVAGAL